MQPSTLITLIAAALAAAPLAFAQPITHGAGSPLAIRDIAAAVVDILEARDMVRPSENRLNRRGKLPSE